MPSNMSFALTTQQVLDETKTETRRIGWAQLKPGELFWAVEKAMGLKPGEKIKRLKLLRCVSNHREPLCDITQDAVVREGFPSSTPKQFVSMFCGHMGGLDTQLVNVIRFEYVPREQWGTANA